MTPTPQQHPNFLLAGKPGSPPTAALQDWAKAWLAREPEGLVVMACSQLPSQDERVTWLRELRTQLTAVGVPVERIRYTTAPVPSPTPAPAPQAQLHWLSAEKAYQATLAMQPIEELIGTAA